MAACTLIAWEVNSFVTKFLNLSSIGHNTSLTLNFNNGKLEVSLNSTIEDGNGYVPPESPSQRCSPARARRSRRRKKARNDSNVTQNSTINNNDQNTLTAEVLPLDITNAVNNIADANDEEESLSVSDVSQNNSSQPLKIFNTDVQCERNMNDILAAINKLETSFTLIQNEVNTLNNDSEISDENIVRVARRITNVEHFLKNYGLATIMD